MSKTFRLQKSKSKLKKYTITSSAGTGSVSFGAKGYQDYTMHKDPARKERYIARHAARENWSSTGTNTAGFWSRWLLWNKPTLDASIKDVEQRFGVKILW